MIVDTLSFISPLALRSQNWAIHSQMQIGTQVLTRVQVAANTHLHLVLAARTSPLIVILTSTCMRTYLVCPGVLSVFGTSYECCHLRETVL